MNELHIAIEVFKSVLKWFMIFVVINNLVWALLFFGIINTSETVSYQAQNGHDNLQEMTNG